MIDLNTTSKPSLRGARMHIGYEIRIVKRDPAIAGQALAIFSSLSITQEEIATSRRGRTFHSIVCKGAPRNEGYDFDLASNKC